MKNALQLSLAGAVGFATACALIIGAMIFTGTNVNIERKFTVSADVGGGLVDINCSLISPMIPSDAEFGRMQVVVQGHGRRGNTGFVGRAIVTKFAGNQVTGVPTGYYDTLNGYAIYRGQHPGTSSTEIATEITGACLGKINMM